MLLLGMLGFFVRATVSTCVGFLYIYLKTQPRVHVDTAGSHSCTYDHPVSTAAS